MTKNMFGRITLFTLVILLPRNEAGVCSSQNCYNLTIGDSYQTFPLESDRLIRLLSFKNAASSCNISFVAKTSSAYVEIRWELSPDTISVTNSFTATVHGSNFNVDITEQFYEQFGRHIEEFDTQILPDVQKSFLRILVQDSRTYQLLTDKLLNYVDNFDYDAQALAQKMINGVSVEHHQNASRMIRVEDCEGGITVGLCPCSKPKITLTQDQGNITCTALSIDMINHITWYRNDKMLERETQQNTIRWRNRLMRSSTVVILTEGDTPIQYTCSVITGKEGVFNRTITVLPYHPERGKSSSSSSPKTHIAYTIFIVVCAVLVTLVISTCVILYRTKSKPVIGAGTVLTSVSNDTLRDRSPDSGSVVYKSLDDLLDLLQSAAPHHLPNTRIRQYRTVAAIHEHDIYDRLDSKLMTVNRGGRLEINQFTAV